jgi:hypothetical protein
MQFTTNMQNHKGDEVLKSTVAPYPKIELIASISGQSASTDILFIEGATKGLDRGYDAGILKADLSFSIYTKLVETFDAEFQLQCLPINQYNNLVIPIGIDSKAACEIVFSVETVQLDPTCKVILEDKLTNSFTDLSKNSYKTSVVANTSTSDRFFLHTGDIVSGVEDQVLAGKVTAYAKGNKEIRILGEVGAGHLRRPGAPQHAGRQGRGNRPDLLKRGGAHLELGSGRAARKTLRIRRHHFCGGRIGGTGSDADARLVAAKYRTAIRGNRRV